MSGDEKKICNFEFNFIIKIKQKRIAIQLIFLYLYFLNYMAPKRTKTIRSEDQETDSMNEKLQDEDSFGQDDAKDDPDYELEILHEQKKLKKKLTEGNKGASSTAHENELFELSKRIWGEGIDNCPTATTAVAEPIIDVSLLCRSVKCETTMVDLDERFSELMRENRIEQVLEKLGEAERIEFKRMWDEIQILELKLSVKRAELVKFQSQIMLNAMIKSSK